ncbi:AbrB/MazE/SpoVT family DNA-binding domain-containing protein [Desulfurococcus mucosus]|uniref:Transcriptional regulator, AbrB family n=1 Tax=Desulfurococcus mucosus (strain ATCC 35584 / DSM 2162 / JCM 9187 / O7/1) TaxID=765177 RepID=E8R752_DESM0|nr:AbrB/MazE/SpoVT family DNA-binding domain-containing protein [Desulfurococcus mucosus]ADV65517.1 transcriptional regulator, AbrB family [Desulfurococcus mucosus DSM 2162]
MPATIEETVKVDQKGRITIPIAVRELFDIREGMYLLMIADKEAREIKLVPLPVAAKLAKLKLLVEDRTGVLAELTRFIAGYNVDIVSTKCVVLKREELGECEMIVDISKTGWADPSVIVGELRKLEPVKNVELVQLSV